MTYLDVLPAELQPGDRLPNLTGDGPAVVDVGDAFDHEDYGPVVPVRVEGEGDPRLFGADLPVSIARAD